MAIRAMGSHNVFFCTYCSVSEDVPPLFPMPFLEFIGPVVIFATGPFSVSHRPGVPGRKGHRNGKQRNKETHQQF